MYEVYVVRVCIVCVGMGGDAYVCVVQQKSYSDSEVAMATRNWSGHLQLPIHSKKRNAQKY